mmetsp:Transcript_24357/g.66092  ORF Transcript_24357/g.66092 Transcript_24357/m.66092 type:complete len:314 (-) Transcript_24357:449-1390(-)
MEHAAAARGVLLAPRGGAWPRRHLGWHGAVPVDEHVPHAQDEGEVKCTDKGAQEPRSSREGQSHAQALEVSGEGGHGGTAGRAEDALVGDGAFHARGEVAPERAALDERSERPEGGLLVEEEKQDGREEVHGLAIPHRRIVHGVGGEHTAQGTHGLRLGDAHRRHASKGSVEVLLDLAARRARRRAIARSGDQSVVLGGRAADGRVHTEARLPEGRAVHGGHASAHEIRQRGRAAHAHVGRYGMHEPVGAPALKVRNLLRLAGVTCVACEGGRGRGAHAAARGRRLGLWRGRRQDGGRRCRPQRRLAARCRWT